MTIFSQAVLKGALQPRHLANGIMLAEPDDHQDDHQVELRCGNDIIVGYPSTGVEIALIREDADKCLAKRGLL